MIITNRDQKIKEFIDEMGICDTKSLSIIFFNGSLRSCQARMKKLITINYVKCFRESIPGQNIFYTGRKPVQWKHKIVCSQIIAELMKNNIEILKYRCPFKIDKVIVDLLLVLRINEEIKIYYCEVERTKKLDLNKYLDLHYKKVYKEYFPFEPSILCVSNKKCKNDNILDIRECKLDLSDLIEQIKE